MVLTVSDIPWDTNYEELLAKYEPGTPEYKFFEDLINTLNVLIGDAIGDSDYAN